MEEVRQGGRAVEMLVMVALRIMRRALCHVERWELNCREEFLVFVFRI